MKKIISISVAVILLSTVAAESAIAATAYPGEDAVKECFDKAQELLRGKSSVANEISGISNPLDPKRDLVCKGKKVDDYLYQSIVDVLFTEIDLKVEKYLKTLEGTKEPMKAIDDLQKKFGVSGEKGSFYGMYNEVCRKKSFDYALNMAGGMNLENTAFKNNCYVLSSLKMQSYYDAGEVIVAREVQKTYQKDKKQFMTQVKDKYRDLLFKLTIYLGQLKVINKKFYTNTKKPSN